jgi:hypothetical protein
LGCENKPWECKFRFSGEKVMDFYVFESNMDGVLLGTRGHAITRENYTYNCSVILGDELDFSKARLFIDDNEFHDLRQEATTHEEPKLVLNLQSLKDTYGLEVPRKINWSAPVGVVTGLRALGDSPTAGLAVVANAAVSAATSGAAMVSEVAVEASPRVARVAEQASAGLKAAAVSAATSGAAMISEAAVEASPHVARAAEQASTRLSAWCCCADPDVATEVDEIRRF